MNNFIMQPGFTGGNCGQGRVGIRAALGLFVPDARPSRAVNAFNRTIGSLCRSLKTVSCLQWFNNERLRHAICSASMPALGMGQRAGFVCGRCLRAAHVRYLLRAA
jgi:hypothetical protein